ncbi:precorrin-2 dehydrogenase/sirohydrochlorin ferrochelatase family protein [Parerythrobacter jejuensis]|uniref:precorrin-2 dehydrogenase n=1 Tax=Parerythrobacter jejuensis TaxID=795812 RepID=A0A845AS73_9SPHN|nr:NAD(P)-dependent oxidoreductase [Parerythrobacter jejuensis]MXP31691.1 siroheme synthase [Parerythrobacter jejuensis]
MIGSLPLFHRVRGLRVVVVGEGEMGEAKRRLVERAGGIPCGEPEAHLAKLAFVALEDDRESEAVAMRLRNKGLLVNVADRPDLCEFTTPSILDREPVLVAVSTSGASAGLAKHLRLRLERILPQSLGKLAAKLRDSRDAMRTRFPAGDTRRRALDTALGEGGTLDPFEAGSADRVDQWLAGNDTAEQAATVRFSITSTDPEDLTLRQARLLGMADVVLHDPAIDPAILDRSRADALRRTLPYHGDLPEGLVVVLERG